VDFNYHRHPFRTDGGSGLFLLEFLISNMTFSKLSKYLNRLEEISSRLKITEILAQLLKEAKISEIDKLCYLILGYLAPPYRGVEFSLAEKMMMRVLARAFAVDKEIVRSQYKKVGDLGIVGESLCTGIARNAQTMSVAQVYNRLLAVAQESGEGSQERKIAGMAGLLRDLDTLSVRFVVRIPLGKLRLGFSEITLLDALSWVISDSKKHREKIEAAYNVRADIGFIAKTVRKSGLSGLKKVKISLGTPVMPALCQRLPTPEEMIKKMCSTSDGLVAVEPKYDGTRLEVHFERGRQKSRLVKMFTRNLENVAFMFPDIGQALIKEVNAKSVILDGEVIGYDRKTDCLLPFQETVKRKRKYAVQETSAQIPLRYFCFDILYYNSRDLLAMSFSKRRQILEKVVSPRRHGGAKTIVLSPQIVTNDPQILRRYYDKQIRKGLEGVVIKKWQAPYDVGKRGFTWVKFKHAKGKKGGGLIDTIDGVVMGYYRGRGRRADFGIGAFLLGVREGKSGRQFLTVSKVGTGLTDEQWREIRHRCDRVKVSKRPKEYGVDKNLQPDVWCRPMIVVEVEADNITRSPIHTAGLALRFPRLVRFRDDKNANEVTTVEEIKRLQEIS